MGKSRRGDGKAGKKVQTERERGGFLKGKSKELGVGRVTGKAALPTAEC